MTINLTSVHPREWQREIERALTNGGYIAAAEALHSARPRDIAEVLVMLPDDVQIQIEEVSNATHNHA